MSFDMNAHLAQQDALRSDLTQLRSSGDAIQADIDAVTDSKGVASACNKSWMHVESTTVFLHDLVLEDNLTTDARAADLLEAMRTYLAGAEAQVKGVMSDEYEVDIVKKRLTMAVALADSTLELLSGYVDDIAKQQRAQLDATQHDSHGWRG
jgi:hypothetical protein